MSEMVEIKLLGVLAEIAGSDTVAVTLSAPMEVNDVIDLVVAQYPAMKLVQCQLAVNQKIISQGSCSGTEELMLMPPFSGG